MSAVRKVVALFTGSYSRQDMNRYYSAFDAAVEVELRRGVTCHGNP